MRQGQKLHKSWLIKAGLAGLTLALWGTTLLGQQAGGTTAPAGATAQPGGTAAAAGTGLVLGGGTATAAKGAAASPIATTNPFRTYYATPMSAGWGPNIPLKPQTTFDVTTGGSTSTQPVVTKAGVFGVPFATAATTTAKAGAAKGTAATTANTSTGFSTAGKPRTSAYVTKPSADLIRSVPPPMGKAAKIQASLRETFQNSTYLTSAQNLDVGFFDGQVMVLRGTVENESQRVFAEGLARLEPGVGQFFLRNEITVAPR